MYNTFTMAPKGKAKAKASSAPSNEVDDASPNKRKRQSSKGPDSKAGINTVFVI